tara:strand:+ start:76 stop:522 length:447 start_codon:yes stop_codon:yes gene_type:complete
MDYNELNNFLQNLEVKEQNIQNTYNKKLEREFNTFENTNTNNVCFTDNKIKDVMLERELGLSNNINYNVEVANPQRFHETRLKKNTNETNNKMNNYNFNNFSNIYRNNHNVDISDSINMNTKNVVNNEINDKLNNRDRLPNNSIFEFK